MSAEFEIAQAQLSAAAEQLRRAAEAISGPAFFAQVAQVQVRAQLRSVSPWCDREAAAAHAHCSVREIDRAADEGIIKRYFRGSAPMFKRAEIDQAIEQGRWSCRLAMKKAA